MSDNSTVPLRRSTRNKNKIDGNNVDDNKIPASRPRYRRTLSDVTTELKGADKLMVSAAGNVQQERKFKRGRMKSLDTMPLDMLVNELNTSISLLFSFDKRCVLFVVNDQADPTTPLACHEFKYKHTIYCPKNDNNDNNNEIIILSKSVKDASDMIFHIMRMAADKKTHVHLKYGKDPTKLSDCVLTDTQVKMIFEGARSTVIEFEQLNFTNEQYSKCQGQVRFNNCTLQGNAIEAVVAPSVPLPETAPNGTTIATVVLPVASATTTTTNSSSNGQFSFLSDEPNMPPTTTTTTATKNGVGKRQQKNDPGQEPCDEEQQKPAAIKKARGSTPPAVVATTGPVDSAPHASANNNNQVMEVHSASTTPLLKKASNGTTFMPSSVTAPEAAAPVCGDGSVQAAATLNNDTSRPGATLKSVSAPPAPSYGTSSSTARSNDFTFSLLSSNYNFFQGSNDDTAGPSTAPLFETSTAVASSSSVSLNEAPIIDSNFGSTFATSSNGGFLSGKATAPSNGTTIAPLSETAPVVASSTSGGLFVQAATPVTTIDSKTGFTFGSGGGSGAPSRVAPASGMDQSTTGTKTQDVNHRPVNYTLEPQVSCTTPASASASVGTIESEAKQSAEASGTWSMKKLPHSNTQAPGSVATSETSASKLQPRAPGVLSNNRHLNSSAPKSDISTGKFPSVLPSRSASAAKPPLAPTSARPSAAKSDASTGGKKPPPPRFRIETHSSNRQCSLLASGSANTDGSDHGSDSERSQGGTPRIGYKDLLTAAQYNELNDLARPDISPSKPSPASKPSPSKPKSSKKRFTRSRRRVTEGEYKIDNNAPGSLIRKGNDDHIYDIYCTSDELGMKLALIRIAQQVLEEDIGYYPLGESGMEEAKKKMRSFILVVDYMNATALMNDDTFLNEKLYPAIFDGYVEQGVKGRLGILPEENLNTKTKEYWDDDPKFKTAVEAQLVEYALKWVAKDLFKKREKKEFTTKLGTTSLLHPKETLHKRFNDVFGDKQPEGAEHPWDLVKEKMSEEDLVLAIDKALDSLVATFAVCELLGSCKGRTPIENVESKMSKLLRTKYNQYDGCGDFHDAVKQEVKRLNVVGGGNHAEYFEKQFGKQQDTTVAESNSNGFDSTMTQVVETLDNVINLGFQERREEAARQQEERENSAVRQQEERGQLVATAERERQAERLERQAERQAERQERGQLLGTAERERQAEREERMANAQFSAEMMRTIITLSSPLRPQQTSPITGWHPAAQGVVPTTLGWTAQGSAHQRDDASSQTVGQVLHQPGPPGNPGLGLHPNQQMPYVLQHPPTMSGQGIALAGPPLAADYASSQTAGQVLHQHPPGPGVVYAVGPNQQMPYSFQQPPVPTTSLSTQAPPPDNASSAQQQGPPVGGFHFDASSQMVGSQVHQPGYHHQQPQHHQQQQQQQQQQPVASAQVTTHGVQQQQQQQNDDVDMAE